MEDVLGGDVARFRQAVCKRTLTNFQLHESHREVQLLSKHLTKAERECHDLAVATSVSISEQEQDKERRNSGGPPKFSLPELKEILHERNSLKARVSDLEDELAVYRPRQQT